MLLSSIRNIDSGNYTCNLVKIYFYLYLKKMHYYVNENCYTNAYVLYYIRYIREAQKVTKYNYDVYDARVGGR